MKKTYNKGIRKKNNACEKTGEGKTEEPEMKKYIVIGIVAAALAGCGNQQQTAMTQPIVTEAISAQAQTEQTQAEAEQAQADQSQTGQPQTEQSQAAAGTEAASLYTGDPETDEENYYRIKAEKEAVDVEIDRLEASFRIGDLAAEEFRAQKQALECQENELEYQEELLEHAVDLAYMQAGEALPEGDVRTLLQQDAELERQENELELEMDALERSYRNSEIQREDFISQMTELLRSEEELERQGDRIERALELQGFDD